MSYLRTGRPLIRYRPSGLGSCVDPDPVYDVNVLLDGGFESQASVLGLGNHDQFPDGGVSGSTTPMVNPSHGWINDWLNGVDDDNDGSWRLSNVNPRTGSWHGRVYNTLQFFAGSLTLAKTTWCHDESRQSAFTARVAPGDTATLDGWILRAKDPSWWLTTDWATDTFDAFFVWYDVGRNLISSDIETVTPGFVESTYVDFEAAATAPSGAYWLRIALDNFPSAEEYDPYEDATGAILDLDDCTLVVTAA